MRGPIVSGIWFVAAVAITYAVVLATFVLGYIMTGGVQVPPAPPALALPALPERVRGVLILYGPCALAGGVVLARSRWWVGIGGGVGLGALSGVVLYLSGGLRSGTPVFASVGWVLAGYVGAVIGQCRRELRGGTASRTTGAGVGTEPPAAPDRG
jgi:hypothetical protein